MKDRVTGLQRTEEKAPITRDIPIARHFPLHELPGLFRRYLTVGEQEYGLALNQGQVVRVFPPSSRGIVRHRVGWAFPGREGLSAVRISAADIHLRPNLFRMASGDELPVPLDALLSATVQVTDPARFYSALAEGKGEYASSDLANEVAASLDQVMQKHLLWYDAQTLCLDEGGSISARLAQALAPTLHEFLAARGVALKSLSILSFRPSKVEDLLVQEVEALRDRVAQGEANIGAVLEKVVAPLQAQGLTTPEEVEKLKTAYAESPPQGQVLLGQLLEKWGQWREGQLQSRVAQLAIKDKAATEIAKVRKGGKGWLTIAIYSLVALAIGGASALLYWLRFSKLADIDLSPGHVVAGASILALLTIVILVIVQAVIDRLLHFIISKIKESISNERERRLKRSTAEAETVLVEAAKYQPPPQPAKETKAPDRLETWLTQESLKTDEAIRRQVGRELSQATTNLNEARHHALRQKQNGLAQSVKNLVERAEAFQAKVEGAAFYSSIIPPGRQARGKANELITFEEDLWRQAQVFQLTSDRLLGLAPDNPAEAEAQVKAMAASLRQLEYHFSRRDGVLEGVAVPRLEARR